MLLNKAENILRILAIIVAASELGYAQKIASLEVNLSKPTGGLYVPVKVDLDAITLVSESHLALFELHGTAKSAVEFQVEDNGTRFLYWLVSGEKTGKRIFELDEVTSHDQPLQVISKDQDGAITIQSGGKNLLRYQYQTVYPPAGVDSAYRRSGFIHPLWSPKGQVLTRIQPKDHYHHYGIWNPWTHVLYEGDTVDFWNIGGKKATVRFANFASVSSGPVFGEFEAIHDHVVFKKDKTEEVAIRELQTVRVYRPQNEDYYIVDITSKLNCANDSPVLLLEYRYGGLGWRTTEQWDNKNSEVLSSEGKTRKDADGTTARWVIVEGTVDNEYAGAVMMSYPTNYNYPEPLRIWPENQFGRGDMFANFSPTKNKDWLLEPGKTYILKYRLLVFNGHLGKEKAEAAWQDFGNTPLVKVTK